MQCLTPTECSEWLQNRRIRESPFVNRSSDPYFQFEPPKIATRLIAFMRGQFNVLGEFPGALILFTDWALYNPDEIALMNSIRRSHDERRPLIEAPGHLFAPTEQAEAIAHCYLALMFRWTAYLYFASGAATLLFWEGDLVDFWSPEEHVARKYFESLQPFELRITHEIRV